MSNTSTKKKPMGAYVIKDRGQDQKALWFRIGSGFQNADGSINVVLNANPLDGKFQLRPQDDKTPESGEP